MATKQGINNKAVKHGKGDGFFKKVCALMILAVFIFPQSIFSQSIVTLKKEGEQHLMYRNGTAYYVKGAGGSTKLKELKNFGGNSIRTWGVDANTDELLDQAQQLGITVCFGLWVGQERQGFDYNNEQAIKVQLKSIQATVKKYKNHPAILMWGVGNELDLDYINFDVWKHLEDICRVIKEEDPNHPIMTVTAGVDAAEVKLITKHAPSVDLLGVNTYGDISYLPQLLKEYGWDKPYLVTEWGPYGWWEVAQTPWGAAIEETSSQKAITYQKSALAIQADSLNCLGSYVFYWGQKQEHTATWFGLFKDSGERTEATDVLIKSWSGKNTLNKVPKIDSLQLNQLGPFDHIKVTKGSFNQASVLITDQEGDPLKYQWEIIPESTDKKTGGDKEEAPKPIRGLVEWWSSGKSNITFAAPNEQGAYRLYLYAYDGQGNIATGNIPFWVD